MLYMYIGYWINCWSRVQTLTSVKKCYPGEISTFIWSTGIAYITFTVSYVCVCLCVCVCVLVLYILRQVLGIQTRRSIASNAVWTGEFYLGSSSPWFPHFWSLWVCSSHCCPRRDIRISNPFLIVRALQFAQPQACYQASVTVTLGRRV